MKTKIVNTNWKSVLTYYVLACAWSWPFFWWRDVNPESWQVLALPGILKTWLIMWGPGFGAIICFVLFKTHKRIVTFQGTSLWRGIVFYSIIPVSFAFWNLNPKFLLIGLLGFVSILGEELGWRGFLQDALKIKSDTLKALMMGVMWEIWHFTNRTANNDLLQAIKLVLIWMALCSVLSYIAIKLTNRTKSLLVAVALHTAVNAGFEFERGLAALLTCLPFWILLLWYWPSTSTADASI